MMTSDAGVQFIKLHERFVPYVYDDFRPGHAYMRGDEVVGTLTIGYGHTQSAQSYVGTCISEELAASLLRDDLDTAERGVRRLTAESPPSQQQFDALVSFAFNVGVGALEQSTLLRKYLEGDAAGAADEFLRWVYSKGKVLRGLELRRLAERALFHNGVYE